MESIYDKLEDFINSSQKNSSFKFIAQNMIDLFNKGEFIDQKSMAELSFVANSTITKFAQNLGYSGYKELLFTLKNEYNKYGHQKIKNSVKSKNIVISILNWVEKNKKFVDDFSNKIRNCKSIRIFGSYQANNSLMYFYDSLIGLNKNPIILHNDYDYSSDVFKDEEVVNLLVLCGKDNKSLIRNFNLYFNKKQSNFLIVSKIQQSKIELEFESSLVIDYDFDDSKTVYRNLALNILFLTIFQEV